MSVLDCRGLSCPEPVIRCRDWLLAPTVAVFEVLVDNPAAVQNVTNFLTGRGWNVESRQEGENEWRLTATYVATGPDAGTTGSAGKAARSAAGSACTVECDQAAKILVFIPAEFLGAGDDTLGEKLMVNFLGTLPELGPELWRIVLVNGGVKLAAGGASLEKLKVLEAAGASILVCGTCLEHYGLMDKKQVGATTNMLDIVTSLQFAGKVIRP